MKIIKPGFEIVNEPDWDELTIALEKAIRTCYKSEKKIDAGTADRLVRSIIDRGHESTLEHGKMTVRFVCDRGVSHELVRHRHCSFSQESTRYVNYSPDGNNNEGDMQFVKPPWVDDEWLGSFGRPEDFVHVNGESASWATAVWRSQQYYNRLVESGWKPEQARSVLPNSLKTEIVVTTNMRDWRHIFHLRCDHTAHPQMREVMLPLYARVLERCPTLFDSVVFESELGAMLRNTAVSTDTFPVPGKGYRLAWTEHPVAGFVAAAAKSPDGAMTFVNNRGKEEYTPLGLALRNAVQQKVANDVVCGARIGDG